MALFFSFSLLQTNPNGQWVDRLFAWGESCSNPSFGYFKHRKKGKDCGKSYLDIYIHRERESYIYMTGVYITVCVYNWVIEFTVVMDVQVEVLATVFPPKFRSTRIGRTRNFRRTKSLFFIFFFFKLAKRRSYFLFFFFF